MALSPTAAGLLLLVAALAGCVGESGPAGLARPGEGAAPGLAIAGRVIDQELVPLADVTVTVAQTDLLTSTAADGSFRLGPIEPGTHAVVAEKPGYQSATVEVQVTGEGAPPILLSLTAVATDVPFRQTEVHVTFVNCWISSPVGNVPCTKLVDYAASTNISSGEKFAFPFTIKNAGLNDLLVEHSWRSQSTARDMTFFIKTPPNQPLTALVVKYFQVWGGAPLRGWVKADVKNGPNWEVFNAEPNKVVYEGTLASHYTNSTVPSVAVYLNHRVESWFTFFYNREGPRDFTALPDR